MTTDDELLALTEGPPCNLIVDPDTIKRLIQRSKRLEEMTAAEREVSEGYLQLRKMLNAWDTPHAPSFTQIREVTEGKLSTLKQRLEEAERELRTLRIKMLAALGLTEAFLAECGA